MAVMPSNVLYLIVPSYLMENISIGIMQAVVGNTYSFLLNMMVLGLESVSIFKIKHCGLTLNQMETHISMMMREKMQICRSYLL